MNAKRIYLVVAACAIVTYVGALWNRWAWDDLPIIASNPLLHSPHAMWRVFAASYWPPELGGGLYRPLPLVTYAFDLIIGPPVWFHAVNLLWHAGASVAVAALARRLSGEPAAWTAGLVFAVHPVHVEAVANVVGRAELMAALFVVLAIYAALMRDAPGWSLVAFACGLLSKENAAVVPALIAWGWIVGFARPTRRRAALYIAGWVALGLVYAVVRWWILHPYARIKNIAAVFVGANPVEIRLTAIAAFTDMVRLLVAPYTLRVDYSPAERTLVSSIFDPRFLIGLGCVAIWAALIAAAWRRRRLVEAFGLGWIGIALLPVANLVFPAGVLIAERTLYLPSAGLALAVGAWLPDVAPRRWAAVVALLVVAGGARSALRVPVWRDDYAVIMSELEDSPRSFDGPARMIGMYLNTREPEKALHAYYVARGIFDKLPWVFMWGADAAFSAGRPAVADSALARLEELCDKCDYYYRGEAAAARWRGDSAAADSLLARAPRGNP